MFPVWWNVNGLGGSIVINVPLKKYELAQALAITPEQFSRTLSELERDGVIQRYRRHLVIPVGSRLFVLREIGR